MKKVPAVSPTMAPTRMAAPPTIINACDWARPAPLAAAIDDGVAGRVVRAATVSEARVGPTCSTLDASVFARTDSERLTEESVKVCARLAGARRTSANADSESRAARERTFIAFSFRGLVKRRKIRAIPRICPER